MNQFKNIAIAILIVFNTVFHFAKAQNVKYGRVDVEEFSSSALTGEENPDAIVLYRSDHTRFAIHNNGLNQTNSVHERILIKTQAGLDYATKKVYLYNKDNRTRDGLIDVHAASYNLVNGDIEKSKLKRGDIFTEDINEYWRSKSFTIPGATVGSIIEFEYKKTSPLASIDDKIIQYDIPTNYLDLKVETLEYFIYNIVNNPQAPYQVHVDEGESDVKNKVLASASGRLSASGKVIKINTEGIPGLQDEPLAGNRNTYRAKLIFELSGERIPNQPYKSYSNTWPEVSKKIFDSRRFGDQMLKTQFFSEDLNKAVESSAIDKSSAYDVLNYVRSKIKWNGNYGKYAEEGIQQAFKKGSGNVADVNLFLISVLKSKGFEVYPVLVSSANNGIPLYPTLDGFNYVIAQIKIGDKYYFLDGTEKFSALNVLPERASHWMGRVIYDSDRSEWINVEPSSRSKDITMIQAELNEDMEFDFTTKRRLTNRLALNMRNKLDGQTDENSKKLLEGDKAGLNISAYETSNLEKIDNPLDVELSGVYKNGLDLIGDKLYVTPLLYDYNDENPFKLEKRKFPLDLSYPLETKTISNFVIPEGYEIESLPENTRAVFGNNLGSYSFLTSSKGGIITTVATFTLNTALILPEQYPNFREFYISIVDKDSEKIVLKKKA